MEMDGGSIEIHGNPWKCMEIRGSPMGMHEESIENTWQIHGNASEFYGNAWIDNPPKYMQNHENDDCACRIMKLDSFARRIGGIS